VISPCVTIVVYFAHVIVRSARAGGHQPQPGHKALLGQHIERVPLWCVE
jgi:hypothetical protein